MLRYLHYARFTENWRILSYLRTLSKVSLYNKSIPKNVRNETTLLRAALVHHAAGVARVFDKFMISISDHTRHVYRVRRTCISVDTSSVVTYWSSVVSCWILFLYLGRGSLDPLGLVSSYVGFMLQCLPRRNTSAAPCLCAITLLHEITQRTAYNTHRGWALHGADVERCK